MPRWTKASPFGRKKNVRPEGRTSERGKPGLSEEVQDLGKDTFRIDAGMDLEDFCEHFGLKIESEMASVGGWIMDYLGQLPEAGQSFTFENLTITVAEVEHHRIEEIDVKQNPAE